MKKIDRKRYIMATLKQKNRTILSLTANSKTLTQKTSYRKAYVSTKTKLYMGAHTLKSINNHLQDRDRIKAIARNKFILDAAKCQAEYYPCEFEKYFDSKCSNKLDFIEK